MKRLEKQFSYIVRQILALFCNLVAVILGKNCVKGIRVKKIVKEIVFEEVWGKLEARNCSQGQSLTRDLRQIVVFM